MLGHVAIFVSNLEVSINFYEDTMGMKTAWKKLGEKAYLTSNRVDILGLLVRDQGQGINRHYELGKINSDELGTDNFFHFGFNYTNESEFEEMLNRIASKGIDITKVKASRDGTKSSYLYDPDNNVIQLTLLSEEYLRFSGI